MSTRDAMKAVRTEYDVGKAMSPLKAAEKVRKGEALVDAAEYGRKAEAKEAQLNDPRYMAEKMSEARRAAVGDLARAPTGGQQAELGRLALSGQSPGAIAATARQVGRGQAEATSQAAAQQGFQAGQAAAQAEQAMLNQLRQRQNALLATAGQAPTTFAETTGQQMATAGIGFGTDLAAGEVEAARIRKEYENNAEVADLIYGGE